MENQIIDSEFVFLGLLENRQTELLFCFLFLLCYLAVLMGNFICLTITCSHLIEQPMYYLLCHLFIIDLFYASTVAPRLIRDLATERKNISYNNCMTQLLTAHMLAGVEVLLLVSMVFDPLYCHCQAPALHSRVMNQPRYSMLISMAWVLAIWQSNGLLLIVLNLPFWGPNQIKHYICDVKPLLKLACKDIYGFNILAIVNSGLVVGVVILVFLASYIFILYHLRTHTSAGQCKTLSTCSSHFMVVGLFFVPCTFTSVLHAESEIHEKEISLIYIMFAPMLDPVIYTLRNAEIKIALQKYGLKWHIQNSSK